MARGIAIINGKSVAHQDIIFNVGGVPVVSLSNLSITKRKIREFNYGAQELPVSYGNGRKEPVDLTFEMSKTEFEAIEAAAPNKDVTDIEPFNIPLTFASTSNPILKTIKNVLIQEAAESSDTDTTDIKVVITAQASDITTN